jgi:hypothetical protein
MREMPTALAKRPVVIFRTYMNHQKQSVLRALVTYLVATCLAEVAPDFGMAFNVSYMLGFVLATWASLFALRNFGISDWIAIVVSLLYAFQPYESLQDLTVSAVEA